MRRLFPGVDPYLEAQGYWPDFHARTITYCCDAIADGLPDQYAVQIDERIQLVEGESGEVGQIRPDLMIERLAGPPAAGGMATLVELEPVTIPVVMLEEIRSTYLEILHRPDRKLIAVLELLSPVNKSGSGHLQYLAKRQALMRTSVHLIELDFLIGGRRLPMTRPLPPGDVHALVARGDRRPDCDVYSWSIRQPLTRIRIPLAAQDPDLVLDLAQVYATAFERGRYARSVDYGASLTLPLAPDDRAWAEGRARATV